MMRPTLIILFFVALIADIYIYRSVVCRYFRKLPARISYIVFAVLTYCLVLAALVVFSSSALRTHVGFIPVMWSVWVFMLITLPKLLFALGGLLDFLVKLVAKRRITVFRLMAVAFSIAVAVIMICGATVGRTRFRVEEVEVCSDRIPEAFDGYRIVQFSDVHLGTMTGAPKHIARLAEKIAGLAPDMVVHTGDLVNMSHVELTPENAAVLSKITAPEGVYSVWGNHDLGFYIRDTIAMPLGENFTQLSEKVRALGWRTLSDESVYIRRGGDSIVLTGVDYPTLRLNGFNNTLGGTDLDKAFGGVESWPYNIVLAHTPQLWHEITDRGFGDLTLSGHVHAMQTKIGLFGWVWSPARYIYEEWSGIYANHDEKNSILYINDGIGCVGYPMRVGARPEVTIFILKRCE